MKKVKALILFMGVVIYILSCRTTLAAEKLDFSCVDVKKFVPPEGEQFFENNYVQLLKSTLDDNLLNNSGIEEISELTIGDPFVIFDVKSGIESTFYYPVMYHKKIVYLIELIGCEKGYSMNISQDMVEELNQSNFVPSKGILYGYNGIIQYETKYKTVSTGIPYFYQLESNHLLLDDLEFQKRTFEQKVNMVKQRIKKIHINKALPSKMLSDKRSYPLGTKLTLHKPQGQHGYQMCWACTVATIVNYIKASAIDGFQVCNRLGKGYNQMGNAYDIADGLKLYGVKYNQVMNSKLSWKQIKANIDKKKPFALSTIGKKNNKVYGHAVTAYGYNKSKVVYLWNSNLNNGNGGSVHFTYGKDNYCFKMNGINYQWSATVCNEK